MKQNANIRQKNHQKSKLTLMPRRVTVKMLSSVVKVFAGRAISIVVDGSQHIV